MNMTSHSENGSEIVERVAASEYTEQTPLTKKPPDIKKKIWISLLAVLIGASFLVTAIIIGVEMSSNQPNQIVSQYQDDATKIINYITKGPGKGLGFEWIANITDKFGPRKSGTQNLADAVAYLVENLKLEQNFSNVHNDSALVPRWVRGNEVARLVKPRNKTMSILGLGSTMYTGPKGIQASAIVVRSFKELDEKGAQGLVKDKIVVYNEPWVDYGYTVNYRSQGAVRAANYSAKAALIRSAASYSINSPHTGGTDTATASDYTPIPAVSITVEDAEMLYRMQEREEEIEIFLNISSDIPDNATVYNTIFDLVGTTYPNEIVMVSGHLDSWDVGQGAMDNAAGCSLAWQTLMTLSALGMRPKRTIRGIFWTAEEQGHVGSYEFYRKHSNDNNNESYVFLMESDEGLFPPMALQFSGSEEDKSMFSNLMPLIAALNVTKLTDGELGDALWWNACQGVPGFFLASVDEGYEKYFAYHHSNGDMPNVYKPDEVDIGGALFTVLAYVMADMDGTLPITFNSTNLPSYC